MHSPIAVATPHTLIKGFKHVNGDSCRLRFLASIFFHTTLQTQRQNVKLNGSHMSCICFHVCIHFREPRTYFTAFYILSTFYILQWMYIRTKDLRFWFVFPLNTGQIFNLLNQLELPNIIQTTRSVYSISLRADGLYYAHSTVICQELYLSERFASEITWWRKGLNINCLMRTSRQSQHWINSPHPLRLNAWEKKNIRSFYKSDLTYWLP